MASTTAEPVTAIPVVDPVTMPEAALVAVMAAPVRPIPFVVPLTCPKLPSEARLPERRMPIPPLMEPPDSFMRKEPTPASVTPFVVPVMVPPEALVTTLPGPVDSDRPVPLVPMMRPLLVIVLAAVEPDTETPVADCMSPVDWFSRPSVEVPVTVIAEPLAAVIVPVFVTVPSMRRLNVR